MDFLDNLGCGKARALRTTQGCKELISSSEKMGVPALSQVCRTRGTGESGPLFSNPHCFFRETHPTTLAASSGQDFSWVFFGYNAVSSKSVSGAICPRESPPFRIKRRYRLCPNVVLRFFHKYLHVPVLKKRQTSLDASFSQRG